ncbi:N-acetylmuramoyl-L-alanine amidase [Bacillus mycoides]|nr:N-acetylmuramoyl-L-alanine amidase [Bacillus mycoides]SCM87474.1 Endolysin [Bacillus mycoides]
MMKKHIIDISKWNNNINWDIAALQVDLAICRVQYGSNTIDTLYDDHVANLEARNIPHGAYAYGCYVSVNDAVVEAKDFLARVNPNAKFLVLDVEDDTLKSCGPDKLAEASQTFINTCKEAGWTIGLYVAHHMYGSYGLQNIKADFLWIPRYGTNDGRPQIKPNFECDIWQYTDKGYVDGIGKVDLNQLIGDKNLNWFTSKGDDRYYIVTGGLNFNGIMEVSQYLMDIKVWAKIQFLANGAPSVETSILNKDEFQKFKVWLDEKNWWYELK